MGTDQLVPNLGWSQHEGWELPQPVEYPILAPEDAQTPEHTRFEGLAVAATRTGWIGRKPDRRRSRESMAAELRQLAACEKAIGRAIRQLQRQVFAGARIPEAWHVVLEDAKSIERGSLEARAALATPQPLPLVCGTGLDSQLRVREVARRYLESACFRFAADELLAFLAALQQKVELTNAEIVALKGFLSLELLERLAAEARSLTQPFGRASEDGHAAHARAILEDLVASLKRLESTAWDAIFESASIPERILTRDPAGVYSRMDAATKGIYRHTVEELARKTRRSESEVASRAVFLARQQRQFCEDPREAERRSHTGFFLVDEGRDQLEDLLRAGASLGARAQRLLKRWPDASYLAAIEIFTLGLLALVLWCAGYRAPVLLVAALFLVPAAENGVALVNQIVSMLVKPRALPKMDFSKGIPDSCKTLVVVPTLLASREQMERAVRDLEVRFLGNRDPNLRFALLTDPPDAAVPFDHRDPLAPECADLIDELNAKYASEGRGAFFLLHRNRTFNETEQLWMGWERKRGKLLELNDFLLGLSDPFPRKAGDAELLRGVRYVITLDEDTRLPRDAARKLVATMAHPLQRAVVDPAKNIVVRGYGILQPRVGVSAGSAVRSRLGAIFSGDTTIDPYTRAVSDVYQDLFGEGSFTGKGIYEVEVCRRVLAHRFPSNSILSHDLIEGAYARAGLVSDVEVIDDYPSGTSAYTRRKQRWIRGDWQILRWLFSSVADDAGKFAHNPISLVSRWKIVDNLRRSLTEIVTLAALLCGWMVLPGKPLYWTLAALGFFSLPAYLPSVFDLVKIRREQLRLRFWKSWFAGFGRTTIRLLLRLACLPFQAIVSLDAIVRTLVRMSVTRRKLLEWETAAQAEGSRARRGPVDFYIAAAPWLTLAASLFMALDRPAAFRVGWPILLLWTASEALCSWLDQPVRRKGSKLRSRDRETLRRAALRTWRFFREFSGRDENYLIPDIYKEEGRLIAHRVSPTNLGLLLNARVAALHLGYLTMPELVCDSANTLATVRRLASVEGHLYNWYDTRTLEPVGDQFVSTVDNGNLICCLWTLKQACLEEASRPIFRKEQWTGIRDHARMIADCVREGHARPAAHRLLRRVQTVGDAPDQWLAALPEVKRDAASFIEVARVAEAGTQLAWWTRELKARLDALEQLAQDFAPWVSPKFHALPLHNTARWLEGLSLETAERTYAEVESTLDDIRPTAKDGAAAKSFAALLHEALAHSRSIAAVTKASLHDIAACAHDVVREMDFSLLYDGVRKRISIGYVPGENAASRFHYDLLASEARAAVFVGIAKGDLPQESWFHLCRAYAHCCGETVLQSWTGTLFEYLMPSLWMNSRPGTLLAENMAAAVRAQQKYADQFSVPWGISESGCNVLSGDGHYHYFAFGLAELAQNPPEEERLVVSPYSTFLSLMTSPREALKNLRRLEKVGGEGAYGFVEAIDFGPRATVDPSRYALVRSWMAHHQGMSLLAIANALCDGVFQRRFHAEPQVAATERILHEKAAVAAAQESAIPVRLAGSAISRLVRMEERSVLNLHWGAKDEEHTAA